MVLDVALAAALMAAQYVYFEYAGRPIGRNARFMAFTFTFVGLGYLVSALFGYAVPLHDSIRVTSVGHVVWSQVRLGALLAVCSLPGWWLGLTRA